MTDQTLIARTLSHLRHQVDRARAKRPADSAEILDDEDAQALVAMAVFVAIQEASDIAFHIVGTEGWGVPASYAEGFELLADHGAVDRSLAKKMASTIRVRNLIAHGYTSVDPQRLWDDVPAGLAALDDYAAAIASFAAQRP